MDHEPNSEPHRERTDNRPHRYDHSTRDYHWILGTPWCALRDLVAGFRNGISGAWYRWTDVTEATDTPGTHAQRFLLAGILPGGLRFELYDIDDYWNPSRDLYAYCQRNLRHSHQNYDGDPNRAVSGIKTSNQFRSFSVSDVMLPLAVGRITNVRFCPAEKLRDDPVLMYCTTGNPAGVTIIVYDPADSDW